MSLQIMIEACKLLVALLRNQIGILYVLLRELLLLHHGSVLKYFFGGQTTEKRNSS